MLFNRAYGLCVRFNSHAIAHDLAYMTESELMGVIMFLTQLQGS
jgi:hydroxyacyl-ACP dehydratase HTD2-like protein with hotdog domain